MLGQAKTRLHARTEHGGNLQPLDHSQLHLCPQLVLGEPRLQIVQPRLLCFQIYCLAHLHDEHIVKELTLRRKQRCPYGAIGRNDGNIVGKHPL